MKKARDSNSPPASVAKRAALGSSREPSEGTSNKVTKVRAGLANGASVEESRSDGASVAQATAREDCEMVSDDDVISEDQEENSEERDNSRISLDSADEDDDRSDNSSFFISSDSSQELSSIILSSPTGSNLTDSSSTSSSEDSSDPVINLNVLPITMITRRQRRSNFSLNNWEGPPRFLPDLARLRQRQSEENNLQPLSQLSLRCISRNWKYFSERNEPFAGLPGSVLEGLVRFLEAEDKLDSPTVLPLVVTKRSRYISVNCLRNLRAEGDHSSVFFTEDFSSIFRKISTTCKENMQELRLRVDHVGYSQVAQDPYPSLDDLNETLVRMTNLTELCLRFGNITDQTVALLAKHCRQLRALDLNGNAEISDGAITRLSGFSDLHEQQGCCGLQQLSVKNTAVTRSGLLLALKRLPHLTKLRHASTTSAVLQFVSNSLFKPKACLQLEEYTSYGNHHDKLESVCKIMKNIKSFKFTRKSKKMDGIKSRSHVVNVEEKLIFGITIFGAQLTKVELKIGDVNFDVSMLAHYCPNLEVLIFESIQLWDRDSYPMVPSYFQKLREVKLSVNRYPRAFSEAAVERMLSSPVLEKIHLKNYFFPNHILVALIEEAKVHEIVFSKLTHMNFELCRLDFERVKEIICVAPNLKNITNCGSRDSMDPLINIMDPFRHFLSRNRLSHIKLTLD